MYRLSEIKPGKVSLGGGPVQLTPEFLMEVELPSEDVCAGASINLDDGRVYQIVAIQLHPRSVKTELGVKYIYTIRKQPALVNGSES